MARLQHTIHALTLQIQRHEAEVVLVHASTATPELVFADQGLAVLGFLFLCHFLVLSHFLSLAIFLSRSLPLARARSLVCFLFLTHTLTHTRAPNDERLLFLYPVSRHVSLFLNVCWRKHAHLYIHTGGLMIPWPLPPPLPCRSTAEDRRGGERGGGGGAGRTARADGCIVVAALVGMHHTPGIHDTVDVMKALDACTLTMLVLVCRSHVYIALVLCLVSTLPCCYVVAHCMRHEPHIINALVASTLHLHRMNTLLNPPPCCVFSLLSLLFAYFCLLCSLFFQCPLFSFNGLSCLCLLYLFFRSLCVTCLIHRCDTTDSIRVSH